MDPHKAPPEGLKLIFKELRSIKDTKDPRMAAMQVLDFGISPSTESAETMTSLERVFDNFHSPNIIPEPVVLRNPLHSSNFYTIDSVPGVTIFPGIIPPQIQRTLLDRLLHRDLSNPRHQTNLHLHYNVTYPSHGKSFFAVPPSDVLFNPKDANLHKGIDMKQVLQKKMRWVTLGGQYDWTKKVYPAEVPPDFPTDVSNLIRGIFDGIEPQAAIVNIYSPGDTLSLHRDVSEEVNQPLVSISLGCECLFLIGMENEILETGFQHAIIRLQSGDALVMTGEARFAWHGVPKIFSTTCPDHLSSWPNDISLDGPLSTWDQWMKNKRININIRQIRW